MESDNWDELFNEACLLHQQHQLSDAIACYQNVLRKQPYHEKALHALGLAYAERGEFKAAIPYLQQALVLSPKNATLCNHLANTYKNNQQIVEAIDYYHQAITLEPTYAEAHHNLAVVYASQNNTPQALRHYRFAIHAKPDFVLAHFNLSLLLMKHHELQAAKTQLNNVLTLAPDTWQAHFYLGVLHLAENTLNKAKECFASVLELNSEHVESLTNLGVIALKDNQGQIAVDYFTKALAIDNDHIEARNNLAATFMHHDRFENALMHYDVLIKNDPTNNEYLYNSGVAQMALGHLTEAILHFETILEHHPKHFAALNNLAAIYIRLEDKSKATELLHQALAVNPEDKITQHMLHALRSNPAQTETCPAYAKNLFNNYALYYDQHMQKQLDYALPKCVSRAIHHLNMKNIEKALDLGCGTGLCGSALKEIAHALTGVDISEKMLSQARDKGVYDHLVESEIIDFLNRTNEDFSLILAADVLPYFGDLDTLFNAITKHLHGYFICSVEISDTTPWTLQSTARFAHHPSYIKTLAEKLSLTLVLEETVIARHQNNTPLKELLYVFKNEEPKT